jgi:hypothetical protein
MSTASSSRCDSCTCTSFWAKSRPVTSRAQTPGFVIDACEKSGERAAEDALMAAFISFLFLQKEETVSSG